MAAPRRETIQKQIEQDWANREYIEVITGNIKRITDFLNCFGKSHIYFELGRLSIGNGCKQLLFLDLSCRSRLASLNEKLTTLERRIEYLEARVTKGETLT